MSKRKRLVEVKMEITIDDIVLAFGEEKAAVTVHVRFVSPDGTRQLSRTKYTKRMREGEALNFGPMSWEILE